MHLIQTVWVYPITTFVRIFTVQGGAAVKVTGPAVSPDDGQ